MPPHFSNTNTRTATLRKSPDRSALRHSSRQVSEGPSAAQLQRELQGSMTRLEIGGNTNPHNPMASNNTGRPGLRFDDDQTQISCSSTKPASSDSRSATSGVTYAMDERESLRPDDSASTRAAEDEDSFSGPASGAPSSRVGSEVGGRAFQDQFNEISGRIAPGLHRLQSSYRRGIPGIAEETPQPTIDPLIPTLPAPMNGPESLVISENPSFPPGYSEPDEKLLEALESSKDRLFLMRLEQEVITFVKDSTEPTLDLPPCNSFCRLLAHKLADYYALTHYVDNAVTSVRLYRTPYCRIPPPLSDLVKVQSPAEVTPTSQPSFQIMRREGIGREGPNAGSAANTTASSMAPSKAGSETGDESQHGTGFASPTESVSTREKATMTREEREAKYKETRARIFKGVVEGDPGDSSISCEAVNGVSRTSSGNGKKKSKKSRRNNDDFEARSQYGVYYPVSQFPTSSFEPTASPTAYYGSYSQHGSMIDQSGHINAAIFQQGFHQGFNAVTNAPAYPMGLPNPSVSGADVNEQYTGLPMYPGYGQQYEPQHYQPIMQHQPLMGQQSPIMSSPAHGNNAQISRPSSHMSDQNWTQSGFSYPYLQLRQPQQGYLPQTQEQATSTCGSAASYPYGQLPFQPGVQQGRTQHPLPGSYNRPSFNPQTRPFVPFSGHQSPNNVKYSSPSGDTRKSSNAMALSNGSPIPSQRQAVGSNPHVTALNLPSGAYQTRRRNLYHSQAPWRNGARQQTCHQNHHHPRRHRSLKASIRSRQIFTLQSVSNPL